MIYVSSDLHKDTRLGLKAVGLYLYLVSVAHYILMDKEGVPFTVDELRERFNCGRGSIMGALKELEDAGYVERTLTKDVKGRITGQRIFFKK